MIRLYGKSNERRPGTRLHCVVRKVGKDIRGKQEDILSIEKFGECKTEIKERIQVRGKNERLEVKGRNS